MRTPAHAPTDTCTTAKAKHICPLTPVIVFHNPPCPPCNVHVVFLCSRESSRPKSCDGCDGRGKETTKTR